MQGIRMMTQKRRVHMFEMIRKFFNFCTEENKRKFHMSVFLGVLEAVFTGMRIPAAYVAIKAFLNNTLDNKTILIVAGIMLFCTLGKTIVNRHSQMLQTDTIPAPESE